jgi:hypothetical protein
MNPTRRAVLAGLASLVALPRLLRAADAPTNGRRFLFVTNPGGWDPLSALAPVYGAAGVQMPPGSGAATSGGLDWVDTGAPNVRAFFEAWHGATHLVRGLSVPSVSHEVCTRLSLTGTVGADRPDWPSQIAAADRSAAVPSLVLAGPSFPGALGAASARAGGDGQLQALLDGTIFDRTDEPLPVPFSPTTERLLDRYTLARTAARADAAAGLAGAALPAAWHAASTRASALRDASFDVSLAVAGDLPGQLDLAATLLQRGVARCVSVSSGGYGGWDSHQNNDNTQVALFDAVLRDLTRLAERLASTPGADGGTLLDEVTVVVLSEMGRTPTYNGNAGRDHWPFTTALLLGAGVAGDRVTGAYDDAGFGRPIHIGSGAPDAAGVVPTVEHLGATLLTLAGVDPGSILPGVPTLTSVLA